jgi:acyl carrier protein
MAEALLALDPPARECAIGDVLAELLAATLQSAAEKIDRALSLISMGIDSLMAMDFQDAIEKRLGVKVSTLELLKGNNLTQLAQHVALTLGVPRTPTAEGGLSDASRSLQRPSGPPDELDLDDAGNILARLDDLTDDQVDRLMAELLPQ